MTARMTAESPSAQSTLARHRLVDHPEDGDYRLSDGLVSIWSRVRNRCRKASQQGHHAEEHRVDRASVSAACLELGQHQRAVSTESRMRVRCHASAPSSRASTGARLPMQLAIEGTGNLRVPLVVLLTGCLLAVRRPRLSPPVLQRQQAARSFRHARARRPT